MRVSAGSSELYRWKEPQGVGPKALRHTKDLVSRCQDPAEVL